MTPDAKEAPPTKYTRTAISQRGLRLLHALLLIALGAWLLARALQTILPDARLPTSMAFAGAQAAGWAVGALLLGAWLFVAAMALPNGRAWAWAIAAVTAAVSPGLFVVAWWYGGGGDWVGVLLGLATVVVLAAPTARELYLN